MKIKKAVVTGGAGFIGSNLVDKLIDSGVDVIVIDDLSTGNKDNINPKATFYKMSLLDIDENLFKEKNIDVVFH